MNKYRPDGWEYQKAMNVDIDKFPKKTWDVAHSFGWRDGFEAGADAMLEVLFKGAKGNKVDKMMRDEVFLHDIRYRGGK